MKIIHEKNNLDLIAHIIEIGKKNISEFHWHEKYEICQLMDNECDFLIDSEEIHAKKGDIITINEYDFHIFKVLHENTHFRIIQFLPKFVIPSLQSQSQLKVHITKEEIEKIPGLKEQIDTLYLWLEKEWKNTFSYNNELATLYTRTLYTLLSQNFSNTLPKNKTNRNEFYKIVEYVNTHFTESINITNISKELYISRGRLSTIFLKYAGVPLTEYIDTLRIEYANKLLKEGKDITNASFESGFSSIRTFNSVYKKIMKITPSQYIKEEK